jgi:hypothetical protein
MPDGDRLTKPLTREPEKGGDDTGPTRPAIPKPEGGNELLRRMKKIDPDQAKRYRQRSGQ